MNVRWPAPFELTSPNLRDGAMLSIDEAANGNDDTSGRNIYDQTSYLGPCTSTGESPHHYVITLFALDLAPALRRDSTTIR